MKQYKLIFFWGGGGDLRPLASFSFKLVEYKNQEMGINL